MPDGTRQTQPLQTYSGLYSGSLPDVANLVDADLQGRAQIENGKLTLPDAMEYALTLNTKLDNILIPRTKAVSIRVGLFKNQRLVAWARPSAPMSRPATEALTTPPSIGWSLSPSPLPPGIFWNQRLFSPMSTAGRSSAPVISP